MGLFPIAKPIAIVLNWRLGPEGIAFLRERDFRALITRHARAAGADVGQSEVIGALNFLDPDDILVADEGELVDPRSIIALPIKNGWPVLPRFERSANDPFLRWLNASGKKWVIIVDTSGRPSFVLDAHHFLRDALFGTASVDPEIYWHCPNRRNRYAHPFGQRDRSHEGEAEHPEDDVIDKDLILVGGCCVE